ncbi:hypothetical protein HF086_012054 [Spodoptera exigua]|uniref:Diphthine--ammonia ligase n=1 Tax=Spodoptera exigua TaxID=7107 RepID=A0A922SH22_SPOEX|nr:hypothetical protein HF086_012054 [Spodoptera exigua]
MRTVALISGGKDSCYNMMQCVGAGHTIVALANLQPTQKDELDSYMYQTVGHQGIDLYAEAMGLPLYREAITGNAVNQGKNYQPTENDEVEDLYRLLSKVKNDLDIEAVAVGAILSDYQRIRVENVDEKELVLHTDDPVAPVGYLNLKLHLAPKENFEAIKLPPTVKNPLDFVNDLSDSVFSDISDIELSETELESIEKLEKEEKKKQNELNPLLTYSGDKVTGVEVDYGNDEADSIAEAGYTYEQAHRKHESQPIHDHRSIYGNKHGWYFIGGIVGEGVDTRVATEDAMKKLISLLESESLRLNDICSVNIYMRDMEQYAALNEVYVQTFNFPNPPTRVCVQCPLPADVGLIFDAVGEVMGTCGQIALVPGTLTLAGGGARAQSALSLRHLTRVLRALHPRAHIRSVVQIGEVRPTFKTIKLAIMSKISIYYGMAERMLRLRGGRGGRGAAPVGAAHGGRHRAVRRDEETGCNVGDYKVAITRRWNYENTVAAFVCYVATGSSPSTCQLSFPNEEVCTTHRMRASSMTQEQIEEVLEYALRKLTQDRDSETQHAVKMRIFYQVWSAPALSVVLGAVAAVRARSRQRAAVTAVPVLALHNAFTFLSISGLRLDE